VTSLSVYLAAPFGAKELVRTYAADLEAVGYTIASTWLDSEHVSDAVASAEQLGQFADRDLMEVRRAHVMVAFTPAAAGCPDATSGGHHVEFGYMLAVKGTTSVVLVGEPVNAFHRLPGLTVVPDWRAALVVLSRRLVDHERGLPREYVEVA
jgi:hypothetical protein